VEDTFRAARRGRNPEALLLFVVPLALYRSQPDRCDDPDANLAFFDKADDAASRGLRRGMTDVFALAGGVVTTIFDRAK
jgi:hypothetical protein